MPMATLAREIFLVALDDVAAMGDEGTVIEAKG